MTGEAIGDDGDASTKQAADGDDSRFKIGIAGYDLWPHTIAFCRARLSGYKVPQWFIAQAKYHGPLGALRYMASTVKQRILGKR